MSLWGLSLVAVAQSAREEIHLDPALAAGKYYAYLRFRKDMNLFIFQRLPVMVPVI